MQSYSSQYINTYEILKNAVIGFEFEFYTKYALVKLTEIINSELNPVKIEVFRKYHSPFVPTADVWKLEPDLSGGENMVELVTGPMPYHIAVMRLAKVLAFLQKHAFTTNQCSVHVNISYNKESGKSIQNLSVLKMVMSTDEDKIYALFPVRRSNLYARSIKNILPLEGATWIENTDIIEKNLKLPQTKYFGINFSKMNKGLLEFRYIGGKDYHTRTNDILFLVDRFCLDTWNSINVPLTETEFKALKKSLEDQWKLYSHVLNYDTFLSEMPTVVIEIGRELDYELVKASWDQLRWYVYDLLKASKTIKINKLNWDVNKNVLEVVDGDIDLFYPVENINFINCTIENGTIGNSIILDCNIKKCDIATSIVHDSDLTDCRLHKTACNVGSTLNNCFYSLGYFDGTMNSGIFRAGTLGPNAYLGSGVKKHNARDVKRKEKIDQENNTNQLQSQDNTI